MTSRETEEKLRKLSAVDAKIAQSAWRLYLSGQGEERKFADDLIDVVVSNKLNKSYARGIFLEPPEKRTCEGAYSLGHVCYPEDKVFAPFGLHEDEWIKHLLITGMTGAGKTNLSFLILRELVSKDKPVLVFDWKRNYRDLLQLEAFIQAHVFTVGNKTSPFGFNPLIPPPDVTPGEWLMKLVDVLKHAYFVGDGVEYLLREAIDWVYDKCGVLSGTMKEAPTFLRVRDYVKRKQVQGRMMLWKASALRVLESVCFRHGLGPVMNRSKPWDYETLLTKPVILELDTLSDVDKVFFTEAMVLWLYEFRKREGKRETFKHAIVIEEGHHILSEMKERAEGAETIMETCLRQIREFGEAVIVIDQEPSKVSNSIKANTYTKITFNLGNGKDILDIAKCMSLDEEESACINQLGVGHAVVAMKGRITTPIYVRFPKMDIAKGFITDQRLRQRHQASSSVPNTQ